MSSSEVNDIIDKFDAFTHKPVKFLTVQEDVKEDIKNLVKSLYDFTKTQEKGEKREKKSALPELIVNDFDEEQIWQEIELQNSECLDQLVWEVANSISGKNDLLFPVNTLKETQEQEEETEDSNLQSDDEQNHNEEIEKPKKKKQLKSKTKTKTSIVDDQFFKLQEMERFLLKEEKGDGNKAGSGSDDESIDMFEDIDDEDLDEEEGKNEMMYNDFFDGDDGDDQEQEDDIENSDENQDEQEMDQAAIKLPNSNRKRDKKVKFADMSDDDADNSHDSEIITNKLINGNEKEEKKSDFELRQQRLQQTITRLEEKNLKDAPWQLKGEVDATKRPQNSLLQEVVDFDLTSRPAPIITEETTITLEDIIRRRIKDKAWDDVVKKEKPVDDQLQFRKPEIIDQSKSKQSLAQVYEAEYLKQKQALSGDNDDEKEPEAHTQIRDAMSKLFSKLDALCHYHYTPKPPQAEVKIVSNTPAISMEEVAPLATSEAALLAPEEVKKKHRGDLTSKDERTKTDKKRERRKKKKLQKEKGTPAKVTEVRNTKKGVEANDKSLKTSKAFFQQLNDDATSLIKNKKRNVKNKG